MGICEGLSYFVLSLLRDNKYDGVAEFAARMLMSVMFLFHCDSFSLLTAL